MTVPRYAIWLNGFGWGVENHGVDPDVEVLISPADWAGGPGHRSWRRPRRWPWNGWRCGRPPGRRTGRTARPGAARRCRRAGDPACGPGENAARRDRGFYSGPV